MNADTSSQPPRRRSGQLEALVLTTLAGASRQLTPGEVRDLLDPAGDLSYSAVVTTLTRLHAKGMVTRDRLGRAYRYGALSDAAGLVAIKMNTLLSQQEDRAGVLRRFVGGLGQDDEQLLRELLDSTDDEA